MKVSNRKCIRTLSIRNMRASKGRNLIAGLAIALTAILFTTLFTIALSINHSFQQANFRQAGGYAHGSFKYLTWDKVEELRGDELIKEHGLRLFVGMPYQAPFNKAHVEIGYSDANMAKWMYVNPVEGRLPKEGTNEAATDLRVLELLGVKPELGTEFTMTFDVDGEETTETFTLSGWWEYDEGIVASHVMIPESRAKHIFETLGTKGNDRMTGLWQLDVMFSNSWHIERDVDTVLANHGYQEDDRTKDNYIPVGVNWGYTGSQAADSADSTTLLAIGVLLLLIIFTGYLIIYNVFQISVTNDIRFYGLLKTIGTTPRQLKRMIRIQALSLSLIGIPIGLLVGYLIGVQLTPVILSRLSGVVLGVVSTSPLIFVFAAAFALITVLISCRRPGKMAARVSPVEALRYTEQSGKKAKTLRKAKKGASIPKMAMANLGRSRGKTIVTVVSLSLAVVLLNLMVTFTNGFDMDKYLRNVVSDFILADASYFSAGAPNWTGEEALSEETMEQIDKQAGITKGGRTYGQASDVQEFVPEAHFRSTASRWNAPEVVDEAVKNAQRLNERLADTALLYGMEPFVLDKVKVLDGDLSKLQEPGGRYVAAVLTEDDYGKPYMDSHWAKLGDTVDMRYVDKWEYYNPETGEVYDDNQSLEDVPWAKRAVEYRDVSYEVVALVVIPQSISYRYYGADQFILGAETFVQDTGTEAVMYYAFDIDEAASADMEAYMRNLVEDQQPQLDYESRETYAKEYESFKGMFTMMGGVLCFIIGLVGVLNYFNAILTGIITRRREFAVLQSIGMTGKQLKAMLVWEGLLYTLGAALVSLLLCLATGPLLRVALGNMFWFFSYRFTILPVVVVIPIYAILGILLPLISYRFTAKRSVVERLRDTVL